jgi:hypothetical protein
MVQKRRGADNIRMRVKVELLESKGAEKIPEVVAYAFSSGGRLLAQETPDEKGIATFTLPVAKVSRLVRVMVGPRMGKEEVRVSELMRRGADWRRMRIDPENLEPSVEVAIIPEKWRCWLWGLCFVRGTLLKRVEREGITIDLPVCNAAVDVYEVDPLPIILPRLPDTIIEKIRDIIINPPFPPLPPEEVFPPKFPEGPYPPPPPGPGPGPVLTSAMTYSNTGENLSANANVVSQSKTIKEFSEASEMQVMARTASTYQLRKALRAHPGVVIPIFCLLSIPVTKSLVATATTDECGRFQTFFFRGCNNPDTPDLYFEAKQRVLPFPFPPFPIYAPTPVSCHTHWNYVCGSEVTLYTTHPLALTCSPCPPVNAPNNWVLVMAIGNLPLSRIHGTSVPLQGSTTTENTGLTDGGAPFGGLLRPRIEFDNSLREDLNVKYYRVSYRKGTSGSFVPLTGIINRHYTVEIGGDLVLKAFNLGPQVVNSTPNLFEIPPALPPEGQWSLPDAVEDTSSAKFRTEDLAPLEDPGVVWPEHGKYQLKIDLFDKDGNLVDIDAAGTQIKYRVPAVTDLSGDIDTDDASSLGLVVDDDGDGKKSFIMTLHVDNSRCSANIAAPTLGGISATVNCGVLRYTPGVPGVVTMQYTARHPNGVAPNGFATYRFRVFRGENNLTLPPAPAAPTLPASGRVPIPPSSFTDSQTVEDLLGGCDVAGFSEDLDVWAMVTNGWRRLWEYDAHNIRAFVLAPVKEGES